MSRCISFITRGRTMPQRDASCDDGNTKRLPHAVRWPVRTVKPHDEPSTSLLSRPAYLEVLVLHHERGGKELLAYRLVSGALLGPPRELTPAGLSPHAVGERHKSMWSRYVPGRRMERHVHYNTVSRLLEGGEAFACCT